MSSSKGFTLLETIVGMVIASLLVGVGVWAYFSQIEGSRQVSVEALAAQLNRTAVEYKAAGGEYQLSQDLPAIVTNFQAEVDANSRRAGFGNFKKLDPQIAMLSHSADDSRPRLVMTFQAGLPEFSVTTSGPGYVPELQPGRTVAAQDWTARVDRAGQVGARVSPWTYDYQAASFDTSSITIPGDGYTNPGGPGSPSNPSDPGTNTGSVTIGGPDVINGAGSYSWYAASTQPGRIAITVPGVGTKAQDNSSRVTSDSRTFAPGESGTFTVTATFNGQTATKTVTIAISNKPGVDIAGLGIGGSGKVELLRGEGWTATATTVCDPLTLKLAGTLTGQRGAVSVTDNVSDYGISQIGLAAPAFSEGQKGTLNLSASAVNRSGVASATRTVEVDIPTRPRLVVEVSDE